MFGLTDGLTATSGHETRGARKPCDYRKGSWRYDPEAKSAYRLERDFGRNPFVKGWKLAYRSFCRSCYRSL